MKKRILEKLKKLSDYLDNADPKEIADKFKKSQSNNNDSYSFAKIEQEILHPNFSFEYLNFTMIDNTNKSFSIEVSNNKESPIKIDLNKDDCVFCPLLESQLFDGVIKHQFDKINKKSVYFILDTKLKDKI